MAESTEWHHYMLPPPRGADRGPSLCGARGVVVLFRKNVTCPACNALLVVAR